jgi:hypothetical protein
MTANPELAWMVSRRATGGRSRSVEKMIHRARNRAVYYHERVRAGGLMTYTTNYAAMSTSPPPHLPTTLLIDKRATLVQDVSVLSAVGER